MVNLNLFLARVIFCQSLFNLSFLEARYYLVKSLDFGSHLWSVLVAVHQVVEDLWLCTGVIRALIEDQLECRKKTFTRLRIVQLSAFQTD